MFDVLIVNILFVF